MRRLAFFSALVALATMVAAAPASAQAYEFSASGDGPLSINPQVTVTGTSSGGFVSEPAVGEDGAYTMTLEGDYPPGCDSGTVEHEGSLDTNTTTASTTWDVVGEVCAPTQPDPVLYRFEGTATLTASTGALSNYVGTAEVVGIVVMLGGDLYWFFTMEGTVASV